VLKISILTLNFPQNKSFSASNFAFFDEKFLTRRRFSDSPKFRGGVPPATTPLIALKYEAAPLPLVVSGAPGPPRESVPDTGSSDRESPVVG